MKKYKGIILLVDDDQRWIFNVERRLERKNFLIHGFTTGCLAIDAVKNGLIYDMALVDFYFSDDIRGDEIAKELKKIHPEIPIFSFTSSKIAFDNTDGFVDKGHCGTIEEIFQRYVLKKRGG